ncbi:enoyl-CoA hydratase/isomerase family protein [Rhodococcus zopfii]|uniref:enoyl-CoA hydratase/isomerase family protein n=1 Tax=Rhodococcus zopfii TaxID=43772 RepID=UPI00365FAE10
MTEPTTYGNVLVRRPCDRVAVVTLDRPDKLNALTPELFTDLERALRAIGDDPDCGAVVLTGSGRAFSAGMDLDRPLGHRDGPNVHDAYSDMRSAVSTIIALRDIPQPVIAAVRGPAYGAGFALAAACDIRIVAPDTRFGAVFVKIGMSVGDLGLSWLLPRLVGAGAASELFYTAGTFDATEAYRSGLAQRVVDDPVDTAVDLAAEIGTRPPLAVRMSKELLNASIGAGGLRTHLELELRSQVIGLMAPDLRHAIENRVSRRN